MAEGWKYLLGDSRDMTVLGELGAKNKGLTYDFNGSGRVGCDISMDDDSAGLVWPWRTCIIAQRDDVWRWSGPITSRSSDYSTGRMTIAAMGWFEKLMHLLLKERLQMTGDAGEVIEALVALANAQYAAMGLPDSRITMGQVIPTQQRTVDYPIDANIGQEIQNLAELEAGIDWRIDPYTRQIDILERRGEVKPDLKWFFIVDNGKQHGNLKNVVENVDGTVQNNENTPRGQFSSGYAVDTQSIIDHDVILSEAPSLSDVKDNDILNAYANAELAYRAGPRVTYTMFPKKAVTPDPSQDEISIVPRLYDNFDLGDTGFLTARRGKFGVTDQAERMFGVDLSIDDADGMETINTLTTVAS